MGSSLKVKVLGEPRGYETLAGGNGVTVEVGSEGSPYELVEPRK
jgi:hypothetical protein